MSDDEFQQQLIKECAAEICKLKKIKFSDPKNITEIMKKYEDKIYERFVKKTGVSVIENKGEKHELPQPDFVRNPAEIYNRYPFIPEPKEGEKLDPQFQGEYIRYPFVGDASFLSNYNRLFKGYNDVTGFNLQQYPQYNVKSPEELGLMQPPNQFPLPNKNYTDPYANSKFYYPHDQSQFYSPIYGSKPINDITNQQNIFLHSDGFQTKDTHSPWHVQGSRANQNLNQQTLIQQQGDLHGLSEEELRLRRNIELLGGIEKTLPSKHMEKSLYDNELRNIEQNFKLNTVFDNTPSNRINQLIQNPTSQIRTTFENPQIRSQSPLRGNFPTINKPPLYVSPNRRDYPPEYDYRQNYYQNPQAFQGNVPYFGVTGSTQAQTNKLESPNLTRPDTASSEKQLYDPQRITLSSSKNIRADKAELLHPKFNI